MPNDSNAMTENSNNNAKNGKINDSTTTQEQSDIKPSSHEHAHEHGRQASVKWDLSNLSPSKSETHSNRRKPLQNFSLGSILGIRGRGESSSSMDNSGSLSLWDNLSGSENKNNVIDEEPENTEDNLPQTKITLPVNLRVFDDEKKNRIEQKDTFVQVVAFQTYEEREKLMTLYFYEKDPRQPLTSAIDESGSLIHKEQRTREGSKSNVEISEKHGLNDELDESLATQSTTSSKNNSLSENDVIANIPIYSLVFDSTIILNSDIINNSISFTCPMADIQLKFSNITEVNEFITILRHHQNGMTIKSSNSRKTAFMASKRRGKKKSPRQSIRNVEFTSSNQQEYFGDKYDNDDPKVHLKELQNRNSRARSSSRANSKALRTSIVIHKIDGDNRDALSTENPLLIVNEEDKQVDANSDTESVESGETDFTSLTFQSEMTERESSIVSFHPIYKSNVSEEKDTNNVIGNSHHSLFKAVGEVDKELPFRLEKKSATTDFSPYLIDEFDEEEDDQKKVHDVIGLVFQRLGKNSRISCKNKYFHFTFSIQDIIRLGTVLSGFPFTLIVSATKFNFKYTRSTIIFLNILIHILPFIIMRALRDNRSESKVGIIMALYMGLYLMPVLYTILRKIHLDSSPTAVVPDTFCFRPSHRLRINFPNFLLFSGMLLEFVQHTTFVFPQGSLCMSSTCNDPSVEKDHRVIFYHYLPYKYWYWTFVFGVFWTSLVLIMNGFLRGGNKHTLYNLVPAWMLCALMTGPLFVTVTTVFLQILVCDYSQSPPTLLQDPDLICWEGKHLQMAGLSFWCMAVYLSIVTLLPAGTYKETMRNINVDVLFIPAYLEGHYYLKSLFCLFAVFLWEVEYIKVPTLLIINASLLMLIFRTQPCSIKSINMFKMGCFFCATWTAVTALVYLSLDVLDNSTIKQRPLFLLSNFTTWLLIMFFTILLARGTHEPVELQVDKTMQELEYNFNKQIKRIHPRALELLISLSFSRGPDDLTIVNKYIPKIVWLVSYPNTRVQFQSAWLICNIALHEQFRSSLHFHKVEEKMINTFNSLHPQTNVMTRMEILAAIVNVSSFQTSALTLMESLKVHKLLIPIAVGKEYKASEFALMALANLATTEEHRLMIEEEAGIPAMINGLFTSTVGQRLAACSALANMLLDEHSRVVKYFRDPSVIRRIKYIITSRQGQHQQHGAVILRNLCSHRSLHESLKAANVIDILLDLNDKEGRKDELVEEYCSTALDFLSVDERVPFSYQTMKDFSNLEKTTKVATEEDIVKYLSDERENLTEYVNLVNWHSWGSKLDQLFEPMFTTSSTKKLHVTCPVMGKLKLNMIDYLPKEEEYADFRVQVYPYYGSLTTSGKNGEILEYEPYQDFVGNDKFIIAYNDFFKRSDKIRVDVTVRNSSSFTFSKGPWKLSSFFSKSSEGKEIDLESGLGDGTELPQLGKDSPRENKLVPSDNEQIERDFDESKLSATNLTLDVRNNLDLNSSQSI